MNTVLQKLVMLQDLEYMIVEVKSKEAKKVQKKLGLTIEGEEKLHDAQEALQQSVPPAVLTKYNKLMERYNRAVAPVVDNSCMNCYVMVPKKLTVKTVGNRELRTCERCGMFLYWV
jgi:predicted  nucleic acid-binding Zn-ribbon protein